MNRETAEQTVIGDMINDREACEIALALVKVDDFLTPINRTMFSAIERIHLQQPSTEPIDPATLINEIRRKHQDEKAVHVVGVCSTMSANATHVRYNCKILLEHSCRREIEKASREILNIANDKSCGDVSELVGRCQQLQSDLERFVIRDLESTVSIQECNERAPAELTADDYGQPKPVSESLRPPLKELSAMTRFYPGELVIVAARPGDGKTSIACQCAEAFATQGKRGLIFSLEMTAKELHLRFACGMASVDSKRYRETTLTDSERQTVLDCLDELDEAAIWFDDAPDASANHIAAKSRLHRRMHGLDYLIIDHLTLMARHNPKGFGPEEVGKNSMALKTIAKELQIPVICLAQLNRESVKEKRKPKLSDLRASGNIEENADVVLMIHQLTEQAEMKQRQAYEAEILIVKQRSGRTGTANVLWFPHYTRFADVNARPAEEHDNYEPTFAAWNDNGENPF